MTVTDADIAELATLLHKGRDDWIHGRLQWDDPDSPMAQADDATIFGPFGGSTGAGVGEHGRDDGELRFEHGGDLVELGVHVLGVGLAEDGADRGGDHLGVALGTLARTLRMKCTRQRCQAAPIITASIAETRPSWASEITSWTPASPRARSERRNANQNAPSSLSPTECPGPPGRRCG